MKHPRTTIFGGIAKLAHLIWLICLAWMIWDFCYSFSPLRHHGLLATFFVSGAVDASFGFIAHWCAADAKKSE